MKGLTKLVVIAVLVTSFVLLQLSVLRLRSKWRGLELAAWQLEECAQLANAIKTLKAAPTQASLSRRSEQELSLQVDRAAELAKLAPASVLSIEPHALRRVKDTAYLEQSTHVELRQVNLEQLIRFLKELTVGTEEHRVTSIRLAEPRVSATNEKESETWSVELTLTDLIYAPVSGRS